MKIKYFCSVCGKFAIENEVCKNCKYSGGLIKICSQKTGIKGETLQDKEITYYLTFEGKREELK